MSGPAAVRRHLGLPGGFLEMDEEVEAAARRELAEETGIRVGALRQTAAFGAVGRDPRGRTITIAHLALCGGDPPAADGRDDAADARWFGLPALPELAFDHAEVIADARRRLARWSEVEPVAFELLPARFTLTALRQRYEAILDRPLVAEPFAERWRQAGVLATAGRDDQQHEALYVLDAEGWRTRPVGLRFVF